MFVISEKMDTEKGSNWLIVHGSWFSSWFGSWFGSWIMVHFNILICKGLLLCTVDRG